MKQKWIKVAVRVAALASLLALSYSITSYIRKVMILAKAHNPPVMIVGDITDREEYAVYNTIIESRLVNTSTELIVIGDQASLGFLEFSEVGKPWDFDLSDQAWADFSNKNEVSSALGNSFTLSKPYLLVSNNNLVKANMQFWGVDITLTPILEFSRVGFNAAKDEALVHLGVTYLSHLPQGPVFSYGLYLWLKKVDGVWEIQAEQDTYIT